MKKEVIDLHENLRIFTKEKEKIDLILSSQRLSLNENGLGFKSGRAFSK